VTHQTDRLYRSGAIALIASGLLFLAKYVLELMAGPVPSSGLAILAWAEAGRLPLIYANEALFFAGILLIPAVAALYVRLAAVDRASAALGSGIMAAAIPVLLALDIVHGRLIYPVYGLRIATPAEAELVVGLFYGGLHAVLIMMAVATIALSLALWRDPDGRRIAYLGILTGLFDVTGSFPWVIGPVLMAISQTLFAAWFLAVGLMLYRTPPVAGSHSS
jgi:hypothetical protein